MHIFIGLCFLYLLGVVIGFSTLFKLIGVALAIPLGLLLLLLVVYLGMGVYRRFSPSAMAKYLAEEPERTRREQEEKLKQDKFFNKVRKSLGGDIRDLKSLFKPMEPSEPDLGQLMPEVFCKHCRKKGFVHSNSTVSASSSTHYRHDGFLSSKRTGFSTHSHSFTQLHCTNCGVKWQA